MPLATDAHRSAHVFITAMMSEVAERRFPAIRGLPPQTKVYIVVSDAGMPLLVADTHAEAKRQVQNRPGCVLITVH